VVREPRNPLYHYHLGLAYAKNGDEADARRSLAQALNLRPDFEGATDARRLLGQLAQ
jgi:Flp pilus assembly protein TadD